MMNIFLMVSQDVPKYTMVAGERAELRGLNLVGLTRRGFSTAEIRSLKAAYRKIFMHAVAAGLRGCWFMDYSDFLKLLISIVVWCTTYIAIVFLDSFPSVNCPTAS
ncbi:probable acyl-[acyl-carrier-protein]--UDP-N-acetylglucosamine O-acyltransferase, mitochondrial [Arachis ipaensis]|uniref:probable acyl-[acyl-carrier-protein]--UDP-N-acetylglucosamine O-acyltransferase, mitochondrial n=1 Tax=Arachis ipaensis TaxID=130454 RepID=UPI000A2B2F19|nr:probable acyl-[acyl-carrier-protein]--UDP-N-acetylglucosamine O-acyltransferase, mitochondrial [Arachis ipaensis]